MSKADQTRPELPPVLTVPSDDCAVTVGGVDYRVHRGQSVSIVGTRTVGELKATWAFDRLSVQMDAIKGEPDEYARTLELMENHFDALISWMAQRVTDWDWTDPRGEPLPKPDGTSAPFERLSPQEIHYLRQVLRGEGSAEAKNAGTSSSATS